MTLGGPGALVHRRSHAVHRCTSAPPPRPGTSRPRPWRGDSGAGAYHGESGFGVFSHHKSVLRKPVKPDLKLLYPPYRPTVDRLARKILR